MVSGPRGSFNEMEPVLKNLGKVFFVGENAGMAQTMKCINNMLSVTALAISAAIAQVEAATDKPVVTAAVATTYAMLGALGLDQVVPGAGALLSGAYSKKVARA